MVEEAEKPLGLRLWVSNKMVGPEVSGFGFIGVLISGFGPCDDAEMCLAHVLGSI